jgi:SAM-dependent methyltransferase
VSESETRFDALVTEALHAAFSGWDWSWLDARWRISPLPWDYSTEARRALAGATCALDQGTGGGEVLSALAPFPPQMVATEGWVRNAPIAAARLRSLGVPVVRVDSAAPQPFPDACFDLVINRHDGYAPAELARILIPGGRFLTQQVGGRNNADLNALLACPIPFEYGYWTAEYAAAELERSGLVVDRVEETLRETTVADIGAVVYYLRAVPWQIADFDLERYRDRLFALHRRIERDGGLIVHEHRFLIAAHRSED